MYTYTNMYINFFAYTHVRICIYTHTGLYTQLHTLMYIHVYAHTHTHTYTHTHIYLYISSKSYRTASTGFHDSLSLSLTIIFNIPSLPVGHHDYFQYPYRSVVDKFVLAN